MRGHGVPTQRDGRVGSPSPPCIRQANRSGKLRTHRDERNRRRVSDTEVRRLSTRPARHSTGTRGSGLGLAIVQAVAESDGGSVALERPEVGSGARFVIRIPCAPLAAEAPAPEPVATGRRRSR